MTILIIMVITIIITMARRGDEGGHSPELDEKRAPSVGRLSCFLLPSFFAWASAETEMTN